MEYFNTEAEFRVLQTESGRRLLTEVAEVREPCPADILRWRRSNSVEDVAAACRLVLARRKGESKFSRAAEMWLDSQGVEQATDETVASYKAKRFRSVAGSQPVLDLCCGMGMDAIALAEAGIVTAVDRDLGKCRKAQWNAGVYGQAGRLLVVRSDAERYPEVGSRWVHIDPDRRAVVNTGGRRASSVADYCPGLPFLRSLITTANGGAIKLGPASDFSSHFDDLDLEIEIISLKGECKEATVWFGPLATCQRRATILPSGATWSDRHGLSTGAAPIAEPEEWIFTPDPALIRAGLVDGFALAHGLCRVAHQVDWLTGAEVQSPFLARYRVLAKSTLDFKRLRRECQALGVFPETIRVRGLDLSPELVRQRMGSRSGRAVTLLLYAPRGGQGKSQAILADRLRETG